MLFRTLCYLLVTNIKKQLLLYRQNLYNTLSSLYIYNIYPLIFVNNNKYGFEISQ